MLSLQRWGLPSSLSHIQNQCLPFLPPPRKPHKLRACTFRVTCRSIGLEDIVAIAQNKVLIAASLSAATGQLSKPFTSSILYKKDFDVKAALQSGGFPSSHSSAAVAAATSLGLERGFSDSIFGMSVVYAALVMYDSQGVRREVGKHAKILNKISSEIHINSVPSSGRDTVIDSKPNSSPFSDQDSLSVLASKNSNSPKLKSEKFPMLLRSGDSTSLTSQKLRHPELAPDAEEGSERVTRKLTLLKESVGHTEIEVISGALLGFFVSLVVYSVM